MEIEIIHIAMIVFVFSIIQSMFGVGLLLFGTPTLLIYGYNYELVLWLLLPPSIAISTVQVVNNYNLVLLKKNVLYYTLPTLVVSLVFIIYYGKIIGIKEVVGSMLLFTAIIKSSKTIQETLVNIIKSHVRLYYAFIGAVHGVSNMGGGPLSLLMTSLYRDKNTIKVNIAFVYLLFGLSQLAVLTLVGKHSFQEITMYNIVIALFVYFTISKLLMAKVDDRRYNSLITLIMFIYGAISFL